MRLVCQMSCAAAAADADVATVERSLSVLVCADLEEFLSFPFSLFAAVVVSCLLG